MKRKNMMLRNLQQTIRKSIGRYIAIVAIIALGAGLFCGLRVTTVDMVATVQKYTEKLNMFDVKVQNTYGWTEANISALSDISGVADVEGSYTLDVLVTLGKSNDELAFRFLSIPSTVNRIEITAGRSPENSGECLLDDFRYDETMIGQTVYITKNNSDTTLDGLAHESYTVVGLCSTPLYLNMQRGSTTVGNGTLEAFAYILPEGFGLDVYTEINLTLEGDHRVYTDKFDNAMEDLAQRLEDACLPLAQQRYGDILAEAQDAYNEGMQEYLDGRAEFEEAKTDALQQLEDAELELLNAQVELEDGRAQITDGFVQLEDGQAQINRGLATIRNSRAALAETRKDTYAQMDEAYNELVTNQQTVREGLDQVDTGLVQVEAGIAEIQSYQQELQSSAVLLRIMVPVLEASLQEARAALDHAISLGVSGEELAELQADVAELEAQYNEYASQQTQLEAGLSQLDAQLTALQATQRELLETKATLEAANQEIEIGFAQLEQGRQEADAQFAEAEAQLDAGEAELRQNQATLNQNRRNLEDALAELEAGELELAEGWAQFHEEKEKALQELAEGEAELADALIQLQDAQDEIAALEPAEVYALTRNTNNGYVVFENDSAIVAGVSEILPAFFLAVAALVCITTMTRMVDEERTQIGIMKALGYSRGAIMFKYLGYSGSGALLGCVCGMAIGSVLFPIILWEAYSIMYCIPETLILRYDWATILFVLISYTGLTLLVTWNCCRVELQNVPAELMRPKAPAAGKKVLLEKLPIWKHLKFLDKVAIRNIFRYRQRLAMMMLGIGGCTALLVTGFGIKDSIVDIVNYQYEQVTLYDMAVTFDGELSDDAQAAFRQAFADQSERIMFCYNGSIDVEHGGITKDIYFLASDQELTGFVDTHDGSTGIAFPGLNEAVLSCGTANILGVKVGDTVTLRSGSSGELTVTISGIYDNYVFNYVIVSGDTLREQWGHGPELTTAFVVARDGQDIHALGADLTGYDGVTYVTICADSRDVVNGMLQALNSIILVIVLCAGLLAAIVLYNLTNINIKERIREIATIKVLGFRAGETASYVFKENLALTAFGTLVGLFAGKYLHALVMSYIRIDMVWFDNRILWISYIYAIILTIIPALIVDFLMYFQLERINMAEALKSVE